MDRSDMVELSELEAKTVPCIVSGSAGKLAGFLSRSDPLTAPNHQGEKGRWMSFGLTSSKGRGLDTKGKKAELGMIAEMGG